MDMCGWENPGRQGSGVSVCRVERSVGSVGTSLDRHLYVSVCRQGDRQRDKTLSSERRRADGRGVEESGKREQPAHLLNLQKRHPSSSTYTRGTERTSVCKQRGRGKGEKGDQPTNQPTNQRVSLPQQATNQSVLERKQIYQCYLYIIDMGGIHGTGWGAPDCRGVSASADHKQGKADTRSLDNTDFVQSGRQEDPYTPHR